MTIWRRTNKVRQRLELGNALARIVKSHSSKSSQSTNTSNTNTKENPASLGDITNSGTGIDLRGEPITVCVCGSFVWEVKVIWDNETNGIGMYFLEQKCMNCGAIATAPTEGDGNAKL